ncbi:lactate/malate dehydrogenase, NAD binding domain-containing protein [Phthorimaea operculella]|nr:lactate/malate dehydrogenase, NAD binding domain-containing protein [Phthorimaea operculella]
MASFAKSLFRSVLSDRVAASLPLIAKSSVPLRLNAPSALYHCNPDNLDGYNKTGNACDSRCRRALRDIPEKADPDCPLPCKHRRIPKKKGILYKIKLKILEGGSNFGTPFRKLQFKNFKPGKEAEDETNEKEAAESSNLPVPTKELTTTLDPRPGVQVSILGADTAIGQYCALLLKQCPHVKKLRLYQSRAEGNCYPNGNICNPCRDMYNIAQDLGHIDTNCLVKAFSCCNPCDLEMCLQNTDIVLMLESGYANAAMPFDKRFECQAPMVKMYADAIAHECPKAVVLVCTSPIDCMVPLVAETMKETGWYDKRKIIGSLAVQEMRASTLAARALCLEPRYTRVPCVGGTEGDALVPLFSKAVNYFDFARHNAEMLTETVRTAPINVAQCGCDGCSAKTADLSEAHALAGLVKTVAHALTCQDTPKITGFVETDPSQVISPARFIANTIELNGSGAAWSLGLPAMSETETRLVHLALPELEHKLQLVSKWCNKYMALEVLLNKDGVCKMENFPPMNGYEMDLMDEAASRIQVAEHHALGWNKDVRYLYTKQYEIRKNFFTPRSFHYFDDCDVSLS